MSESVIGTFHRSVDEGVERLNRGLPSLLATGVVGGIDVSIGLFAFLVVLHESGSRLLASLAFTIGFIALILAKSELFTENFLVPIAAAVAGKAKWRSILRLWAGTALLNLVGAFVVMGLAMSAFPELRATAVSIGTHPVDLGITWAAFADAILAGVTITLMTWMDRSTESVPAKLIAAIAIAFLLVAAPLQHAVVMSAEAFAALHAGAPFGYLDWLGAVAWAALGNIVGGVGLVTVLRLAQVGPEAVREERERPDGASRVDAEPDGDDGRADEATTA
ncbi:MAG: formate/nitrite transporter family protein [Acidimicrobiales bacterium]